MKQLILFIILLFFLSCSKSKTRTTTTVIQEDTLNTEIFKSNFSPIIDDFIDSLKKEQIDDNAIAVVCFPIKGSEYILLMTVEGYNAKFMKGFAIYRDILVYYSGVDSLIANKIFNLEALKTDTPSKEYMNINDIDYDTIYDPIERFYIIDIHNVIKRYEPMPNFQIELHKLEIKHGFSL